MACQFRTERLNADARPPRRGAGVVERGGLENRCGCKPTQGSNPCLSANIAGNMLYLKGKVSSAEFVPHFVPQCNRNFEPDGPMLGWLVDRKIAPHIPVIDQAGRTDGTWSRADFEWDAENNQYICPEGEALKQFRRNYSDPNRGPTGKGVARYQALKHTCQARPSKPKCCPRQTAARSPVKNTKMRAIWPGPSPGRPNTRSSRSSERRSRCSSHTKHILGLGRLRLRGPCGANDVRLGLTRPHWGHGLGSLLLAATAQNLRKLAKIFPAPQQTQKA